MAQEHRADVAEAMVERQEATINVMERAKERAEDAAASLQRQLQAQEGAAAVQRAEMASIKRDLEAAVRDSLRYQDTLQDIANNGGTARILVTKAREVLSSPPPYEPAPVAHPPTNGAPR